jgi:hypothetical protein
LDGIVYISSLIKLVDKSNNIKDICFYNKLGVVVIEDGMAACVVVVVVLQVEKEEEFVV